jgi:hypothetical protein
LRVRKVYKFNLLTIIMKIFISKELDIKKINEYLLDGLQENLTKPYIDLTELGDNNIEERCIIVQKEINKDFADNGLLVFDEGIKNYHDMLSKNTLFVGLRNFSSKDYALVKNIKHYSMKEISSEGIEETCNAIMSACREFKSMNVIINSDVLDPAFSKKNNTPGGLSTRELIYLLQRIKLIKNFKIIQIISDDEMLAAKLILELS